MKDVVLLNEGVGKMAHEARTDWAMILGSIFLLVVGAWSFDALRVRTADRRKRITSHS